MKASAALILLSLTTNLFSATSVEVTPETIGKPIFPPKIENVEKRLARNNASELLNAIDGLELVFKEWVSIDHKNRIVLIFDSSARVFDAPRVMALLDENYKALFWKRFDTPFFFGYATFIHRPSEKEAEFVVINPATRFTGELFFQRYHITSDKIADVSEGYTWNKVR